MLQKKKVIKEYEYPLTKGEIKYKIFMNPDGNKCKEIRQKIRDNNFHCISQEKVEDTKCICKNFKNLDKENVFCDCGLYYKVARTEEEIKKFITSKKVVSKNEKQILKEPIVEEEDIAS
jgi:hypothetical protein